jgi:FkbM family methyltransferase
LRWRGLWKRFCGRGDNDITIAAQKGKEMRNYSEIRNFYNKLEDEQSRFIFMCRWQHLATGDDTYLMKLAKETYERYFRKCNQGKNIDELFQEKEKPEIPVVLYGTGQMAEICLNYLNKNGIHPAAFSNSAAADTGKVHLGHPLIPKEALIRGAYADCRIVVATLNFQTEIYEMLLTMGVSPKRIYTILEYEQDIQYFGPEFIKPENEEIFVDGGALDGATIEDFVRFTGNTYKHIYTFEPHPDSCAALRKTLREKGTKNVTVLESAVWDCDETLEFAAWGGSDTSKSRVAETSSANTVQVKAEPIDGVVKNKRVTFIKLDVEGAELRALKGAEKTIINYKPRLAVCVYHKPEDIVEIPLYIARLRPDYKFFIRHHAQYNLCVGNYWRCETVLYAV